MNIASIFYPATASKPLCKFGTLLQILSLKILASNPNKKSVMLTAQILWWGLGLTLAYDICESLLQWPHWIAMTLYSALMIASTWFGLRSMILIAFFTLPSLLGVFYFSAFDVLTGTSFIALWSQLLANKLLEYLGWFLMVLGGFINAADNTKKITISTFVCYACLAIGGTLMLASAVQLAQNSDPAKQLFIGVQQISYFLWIFGLTSTKITQSQAKQEKPKPQKPSFKLPSKYFLLIAGTIGIVIYDWMFLNISGWMQCGFILIPPCTLLLISRYLSFD